MAEEVPWPWLAAYSDEGVLFYTNQETNETVWELPEADNWEEEGEGRYDAGDAGDGADVSDWTEQWDEEVEARYWFNNVTQEASWVRPEGWGGDDGDDGGGDEQWGEEGAIEAYQGDEEYGEEGYGGGGSGGGGFDDPYAAAELAHDEGAIEGWGGLTRAAQKVKVAEEEVAFRVEQSQLFTACERRDEEAVLSLLEGAFHGTEGAAAATTLRRAPARPPPPGVGGHPGAERLWALANAPNPSGLVPLHACCLAGAERCAAALLANHADPRAVDQYGSTCLHFVARSRFPSPNLVRLLLRGGLASGCDPTQEERLAAYTPRQELVLEHPYLRVSPSAWERRTATFEARCAAAGPKAADGNESGDDEYLGGGGGGDDDEEEEEGGGGEEGEKEAAPLPELPAGWQE